MKRSSYFYLLIISLLVISCQTVNVASAAEYNLGVSVGNSSTYTISSIPNLTKSVVLVHGVVGKDVTLNVSYYLDSGNLSSTALFTYDVSEQNLLLLYLVAGGLQAGDPIQTNSSLIFNSTSLSYIQGMFRNVNHIKSKDGTFEATYDQASGIIVSGNIWFLGWINMTLASTSVWHQFLNTTVYLIIGGVAVVAIVIYVLTKRKPKKSKKRKKK
ncbi:MAG: hypothetical protein ACTSUV_00810 [Candidatus Ranarchaeia archaeon]